MQHYRDVDPREEWKRGFFGWFLRIQGIFGTTIIKLIIASISWWAGYPWLAALFLLVAVFCAIGLYSYRHFILQRMDSDRSLHIFSHNCRTHLAEILRCDTPQDLWKRINQFEKDSVELVADFFKQRISDSTINCAIRTARERKNGEKEYATAARSKGMHPSREENSEAISSEKGLPVALMRKDFWGAFIITDIADAAKNGNWIRTKNDDLPGIQTLMVSPINGFRFAPERKRGMVGILYVTSAKKGKRVFKPCDTVPLTAFADFLGLIYSIICRKMTETNKSYKEKACSGTKE